MTARFAPLLRIVVFVVLASTFSFAQRRPLTTPQHPPKPVALEPSDIAERLKQSLVLIETKDKLGHPVGQGSGFFIDQHTIATNLHLFKWAHSAIVKILKDGVHINAQTVLTLDRRHDLCTFKVEYDGIPVKITSKVPRVGDRVYALGNPLGYEATFSSGMVTALRSDEIQMDAPISPGSSGGPVANDQGEVFGVSSSSVVGGQNLNFVVPLTYLSKDTENLAINLVGRAALSDWDYLHLTGSVKSLKIWRYEYKNGQFLPAKLEWTRQFDSSGHETESCFYSDQADPSCYVYERGLDTFVVRRHSRSGASSSVDNYDHKQAVEWEADYHHLSEELKYTSSADGVTPEAKVFDSFGDPVETRRNGIMIYSRVFEEPGLLSEVTGMDASGKITYHARYQYEFDSLGNWTNQREDAFFINDPEAGWLLQRKRVREITYWGP